MKLEAIKVKDIVVPEVRVTSRFDPETWEQFKAAMSVGEEVDPILLINVEGQMVLCDGLHRLQEASDHGSEYVTAVVIPGDMVDVLTKNLMLDHLRGKHPASEMVQVVEVLWKEFGLDSDKIAERTGMKRDYIEKLQKISMLTPMCRDMLDQERIKVGHAEALAKIDSPSRQEVVLQQCIMYNWTVKELIEYIKQVEEVSQEPVSEPRPETPAGPITVKCAYCHQDHELHNIANPNTCSGCAGILYQAMAMAEAAVREEKTPQNDG